MTQNVFKYESYKKFLLAELDSPEARGMRSQLAKHLNCQSGFISQVLNGDRHFSLEHVIEIAVFFKMSPAETDYFVILAHYERAGSEHLREYYMDRMEKLRLSRQRLPLKNKELSDADLAAFHSHWYHYAAYELLGLKSKPDIGQIAETLDVSVERIEKAVRFLAEIGVVEEKNGRWEKKPFDMAVGRKAAYVDLIHRNFRIEAIRSLDRRHLEDSHYSRFFTVSKKKASLLQEQIAEFVKGLNEKIAEPEKAQNENLYSFSLDCFRYGK